MSRNKEPITSNCEKKFLIKCLAEYTRLDGRAFDEFRELTITFGKDWGSCFVSLGKTKVIAQVSCEIQPPKSSRPSEGILNINLELSPMAALYFEAGRQSEHSIQLNRLLEKCIKDSKTIDLESLCIKVREKVWAFRLDLNVVNHEGNILDCASVAALSALAHFRRPDVTCDGEEIIVHSFKERDPICTVVHHYPIYATYAIFNHGDVVVADPTVLEENVAEAHLTVAMNAYKELCGLHLGGTAQTNVEVIMKTTKKAADRALFVVQQIKEALQKDNEDRQKVLPIGFQQALHYSSTNVDLDRETLVQCLDTWKIKSGKRKKPKDFAGIIENLGEGTAVLLPENSGRNVWNISSEDESDEEKIVPIKKEFIKPKEEDSDSSEEEKVIILNANEKTQKNARNRWKKI